MTADRVLALNFRTNAGTVNYYDNLMSMGTSFEKVHAARIGSRNYNLVSHKPENLFTHLRAHDGAKGSR